jgi:hypothetical protein
MKVSSQVNGCIRYTASESMPHTEESLRAPLVQKLFTELMATSPVIDTKPAVELTGFIIVRTKGGKYIV